MTLDPVTLTVIQSGLVQVCNEMDIAFSRAAFSPVIAEANDRSDGIYALADGALIAQGELGLPVFVGTMQDSAKAVIDKIAAGETAPPEPDDVYIVNDPYLGGTHLMDVRFIKPFFYQGRHWCWLANTGHWPDIGGAVPGGFSASATEIEQEGLRLPPVKLFKRGAHGPRDLRHRHVQHPRRRAADRRHQGPGGSARGRRPAAHGTARPLRCRDRRDRHPGAARRRRQADARQDQGATRRQLPEHRLGRFRRRGRRAARHPPDRHQARRHAHLRPYPERAALPGADELGDRHHPQLHLSRGQAHLARGADQCRPVRATAHHRSRRHLPLCRVPAAGLRLCRRGLAAHRRGGLRRPGPGGARPGHRRPRRHVRQFLPRRRRSGQGQGLRDVPHHRRRLWRQRPDRRARPTAARPSASRSRRPWR